MGIDIDFVKAEAVRLADKVRSMFTEADADYRPVSPDEADCIVGLADNVEILDSQLRNGFSVLPLDWQNDTTTGPREVQVGCITFVDADNEPTDRDRAIIEWVKANVPEGSSLGCIAHKPVLSELEMYILRCVHDVAVSHNYERG